MPIVLISSRFEGSGEELAASLAAKTGWPMLCRSEMQDMARARGIRVGRLEMSVIKAPGRSEGLERQRKLYVAFLTATLCGMAGDGNLIYYGRAGHMLLPGVAHRLRVGLTVPYQQRVQRTARTLNLSQDRAELYLQQLDQDFEQWIKHVHRAEGRDADQFDVCLNLEQLGLTNAAALVCEMAQMPDFRPTPRSLRELEDMGLAARAEVELAFDERTALADVQVQADDGVLTVTYSPREEVAVDRITEVLSGLEGCRKIQCTMAETNILWVQERFDPDTSRFTQLTQLAKRWGAAVELMRLVPPADGEAAENAEGLAALDADQGSRAARHLTNGSDGGVEDDSPYDELDDGGLTRTQEELLSLGQAAGKRTACGGYEKILDAARDGARYSLVVIGDIFLSKGPSARTRMARELALSIRDRLKAPVILATELEQKFMFGPRQAIKLLGFLALVVVIYTAVFQLQEPVMELMGGQIHDKWRWAVSVGVALFVPLVAYLYGTVAGLALKLINID